MDNDYKEIAEAITTLQKFLYDENFRWIISQTESIIYHRDRLVIRSIDELAEELMSNKEAQNG